MDTLKDNFRSLLSFLKKSVPFFSGRYQGHMNWDTTLPSVLGYFAAMLYNPNNVAFEGSTATTILEMIVGDDLCRMLGYSIPDGGRRSTGAPSGPGGTSPAAGPWPTSRPSGRRGTSSSTRSRCGRRSRPSRPSRRRASSRSPRATGRREPLVSLDTWSLLNLKVDDILALPGRLTAEHGISGDAITEAMAGHSLQHLGMQELYAALPGGRAGFAGDPGARDEALLVPQGGGGPGHRLGERDRRPRGLRRADEPRPTLERILRECLAGRGGPSTPWWA